jgi:hypothetical protein
VVSAGMSWKAHPDVMSILYKGLIRFILEYGCTAFDRMTATNMLKLERIQYRCLRIALELMQCTHVQILEGRGYWWSVTAEVEVLNALS